MALEFTDELLDKLESVATKLKDPDLSEYQFGLGAAILTAVFHELLSQFRELKRWAPTALSVDV